MGVPAPSKPARLPGEETYPPTKALDVQGTREDFMDLRRSVRVKAGIARIVGEEAPITVGLLARRIAPAWDVARITKKITKRVEELVRALEREGRIQRQGDVLWRADQDPAGYRAFRCPGEGAEQRKLEDIPDVEIANAAQALLRTCVSLPEEDLAREVARVFGIKRMGKKVQAAAEQGIGLLRKRGVASFADGMVTLLHQGESRPQQSPG